jgi:glycosylphosphatidylinositol transamidase (GPIT) subunit GPI8
MKRILLLPLIALLFSCGGTTSKYEKLIADVVQTDRGVKLDLNFKAEELDEIKQISVADSIKIITDSFNAERDKQMASLEKTLSIFTESIEKAKAANRPSQVMIDSYQSSIDKTNERIDALKKSVPNELAKYENRDINEILAVIVRCTYTIDEPLTKKRATETFDFYLSPDGAKFYSKKRVKE